jgi:hypothetical protein
MVFGGYGRKTKVRGEVFFPCMHCEALNVFGLVENYGYGQLYGLRLAKYKTNRLMLCSHCHDGYGLDKDQWGQAMLVSKKIKARANDYSLSMREMAELAVWLAREIFPADTAEHVRSLLAPQLGGEQPELTAGAPRQLPPGKELRQRTHDAVDRETEAPSVADEGAWTNSPLADELVDARDLLYNKRGFEAARKLRAVLERAVASGDVAAIRQAIGLLDRFPSNAPADLQLLSDARSALAELEAVALPAEGGGSEDEPPRQTGDVRPDSPLQIARERYARGEINRDEFLQLRDDLQTPAFHVPEPKNSPGPGDEPTSKP